MNKPLTIRSKFALIMISLVIFVACSYFLKLGPAYVFVFFLLTPLLIIVLGKTAELLIHVLERVSTGPLSLIKPSNALLLMGYYLLFSIFLATLIDNSIVLSLLSFRFSEWQVAAISLGLAFLPRVLSYTSSMERARSILLAILTPLTLTATIVLFIQPESVVFRLKTLEFCVVGSIPQTTLGDVALYFASFTGMISPKISIETISMIDLRRLVHSQLETVPWNDICNILVEAKKVDRVDVVQNIIRSMGFFLNESEKRRAKLARISFVDALVRTIFSNPGLREGLIPFLNSLQNDPEAEVRARVAPYCITLSREMPSKGLKDISEWLDDNNITVLQEIGRKITDLLRSDPNAPLYAIKLSLNPAFIQSLVTGEGLEFISEGGVSMTYSPNPVIQTLKAAYMISPNIVSKHIDNCSLGKDPKLRILAAAIVSDQSFAKDDKVIAQVRERLKKDKNLEVRMCATSYDLRFVTSNTRWGERSELE